jgi:hypothetical protein
MRFKWWKFGMFLAIGLTVFGTWATYNYTTYVANQEYAQEQIYENVSMIEETVYEIEEEQMELRMVQEVVSAPVPVSEHRMESRVLSRESAPAPPPPVESRAPASTDPMYDELQARIDELEREKEELKREKHYIRQAIEDSVSVFKGVKVDNPLVNAIIIPIFLYLMKKLLDFGFARLEDWYEEKHGEKDAV